jgi:iron complex transport system permease protein
MVTVPEREARPVALRIPLLLAAGALLVLVVALSISVGAKSIPLADVWGYVFRPDGSDDAGIVQDQRIPRTILGLAVGAALGAAGALMQALTRNPLADPGLLGVNAGAATAIVIALAALGTTEPSGQVWFAFLGAAAAAVLVYGIGSAGGRSASPVRLAIAGMAVTFALLSVVAAITITHPRVFDQYRFWQVGSLAGRGTTVIEQLGPFVVAGLVLALLIARPLNALALGDDVGRGLGVAIGRTRVLGAVGVTLLCGAATAAAGPIGFVGLTVPHVARAFVGPDQRWVLPVSMLLAAILLVGADVLGRVVTPTGELEVGIVTAIIGAPVFIAIVRRRRVAQL